VYHVWNRAAGRLRLLEKDGDFLALERIQIEARARSPAGPFIGLGPASSR
jgi:hypothetical protein